MNPVCVSTWSLPGQKHFQAFLDTAKKHGIDPVNADPEPWPGTSWENKEWWRKSAAQARFVLENNSKFTHFLFCDSYDIMFAAGWDEILKKFEALNSEIVFAAESYPWPDTSQAPIYPATPHRAKYANAGFWMATSDAATHFTRDLAEIAVRKEKCDQGIIVDMFLSGKYPIKLDTACSICFCCNLDSTGFLEFKNGRIHTTDTGEAPCLFHGNGNAPMEKVTKWI